MEYSAAVFQHAAASANWAASAASRAVAGKSFPSWVEVVGFISSDRDIVDATQIMCKMRKWKSKSRHHMRSAEVKYQSVETTLTKAAIKVLCSTTWHHNNIHSPRSPQLDVRMIPKIPFNDRVLGVKGSFTPRAVLIRVLIQCSLSIFLTSGSPLYDSMQVHKQSCVQKLNLPFRYPIFHYEQKAHIVRNAPPEVAHLYALTEVERQVIICRCHASWVLSRPRQFVYPVS